MRTKWLNPLSVSFIIPVDHSASSKRLRIKLARPTDQQSGELTECYLSLLPMKMFSYLIFGYRICLACERYKQMPRSAVSKATRQGQLLRARNRKIGQVKDESGHYQL